MCKKPRVLFILKLRQTSGGGGYSVLKSSGLLNSATYVNDMLRNNLYESKLVQVVDNNSIDKQVHEYKPDVVIIEALWVVPEKFKILQKLHPNVKWIIRLHSEIPFLANEGSAIRWITEYATLNNVYISFNSWNTHVDFENYLRTINKELLDKLIYLPNYYPISNNKVKKHHVYKETGVIDVGCFGAIRPMKNTLIQAFAAVKFAEKYKLKCRFHVNAGRTEQHGESALKNLRSFFAALGDKHELVEHGWLDREQFTTLVSAMDIGLQMSFSETFNIVSADFVERNIPIVTSKEIEWMPTFFTADPTNTDDIVRCMERVLKYNTILQWIGWSKSSLKKYVRLSEITWLDNLTTL